MKRILITVFAVLTFFSGHAQLDRSVRPEAGPAPELDFGKYKLYELKNGLKVIVVEDHKLPRITMNLLVDRDPVFEGEKAGYVQMAGEMLRQGTTNRPKDKLDEEIDFIGASLNTSSTNIYTSGLSKYSEKLVEIMADVALNPAFPQEEFEKIQKQFKSGIESSKDDPEAVASTVHNAVLYGKDHPYGEDATIETVENVDLEDCKNYYKNYWMPNSAYIAIVGDIKPKAAKKLVEKYFGEWEQANKPQNVFKTPEEPEGVKIAFVNREAAVQSVLNLGNVIHLKPGDNDVVKMELTNHILGGGSLGRLFQNIREDKGYTYGAYSSYDEDRLIGSFTANASVRNEVTDSAITEFLNEFEKIRSKPVSPEELQGAKNAIIGDFGRALEHPQTIAAFALNIERYNLPKDYYENYLKRLGDITAEDIMATAGKYIKTNSMHITVVGKASEVADKLEKFGEIQYYDEEGNKTSKPSLPLPEGLTAQQVIDNYIAARGGADKLKKVKSIHTKMEVDMPGAPTKVTAEEMKKSPDKYKSVVEAEGMGVIQKQVYDGETGVVSGAMQAPKKLEGEDLAELKLEAMMNKELQYDELGYDMKLVKAAMVDDVKAYVLELTSPTGQKNTLYFAAESGLLLKSETTEETQRGPMTSATILSDYKEVDGVKYPYTRIINIGPQKIKMNVTDIKVNTEISDSEFKTE